MLCFPPAARLPPLLGHHSSPPERLGQIVLMLVFLKARPLCDLVLSLEDGDFKSSVVHSFF